MAALKLAYIEAVLIRAQAHPDTVVVQWLDEFTFYRQPDPAPAWCDGQARHGSKTHKTPGANTKARVGACFISPYRPTALSLTLGLWNVSAHYALRATPSRLPQASEIYVIQDCWPVHFFPEVSCAACRLGITLVPLPTYSSGAIPSKSSGAGSGKMFSLCIPGQVIAAHQARSRCFRDRFLLPSPALLHYVGLSY